MSAHRRQIPASLLPLSLLLLAAVAALILLDRDKDEPIDLNAGGPLLTIGAAEIVRLDIKHRGADVILTQDRTSWRLDGTVSDLCDRQLVGGLLADLTREMTTPILPATDPLRSRSRYRMDGPDAIRLAVTGRDGRETEVSIGAGNQVTGRYYALGAGRTGVFTISASLVATLLGLPGDVRSRRLWPDFDHAAVETVILRKPGLEAAELFARAPDGSWWFRQPAAGMRLSRPVRDYDRFYGDRRRAGDDGSWWRASDRMLDNLLFLLGDTSVRVFRLEDAPPDTLRAAGLQPPTVAVEATFADGRRFVAAFGHALERARMLAVRDGRDHLLVVTDGARDRLLAPLSQYIEAGALPFIMATADSFAIARAGGASLHARREGDRWLPVQLPPDGQLTARDASNLLGDLVVYLDRLEMLEALPPSRDDAMLGPGYRATLTVWLSGDGTRRRTIRFGPLPDGVGVGIQFLEDGRLLVVDANILVTIRAVMTAFGLGPN